MEFGALRGSWEGVCVVDGVGFVRGGALNVAVGAERVQETFNSRVFRFASDRVDFVFELFGASGGLT